MGMRMNTVARHRWLGHFVAGGKIVAPRKWGSEKFRLENSMRKVLAFPSEARPFRYAVQSKFFPNGFVPMRRDDLIFWLLFDQAKSSINYNKRKKNQNQNGNENEYGSDASLVEPLRGRMGKFPNGFVPSRLSRDGTTWFFWLLFDQAKSSNRIQQKETEWKWKWEWEWIR